MIPDRKREDPQDKEFGASAAAAQDRVDELIEEGLEEEDMPDSSPDAPRAAGKATP